MQSQEMDATVGTDSQREMHSTNSKKKKKKT